MSTTKIEWTATRLPDGTVLPGYTFNPWIGCWKISRACENCYAAVDTFARVQRKEGNELWGRTSNRHVTGSDNWKKPLSWNRQAERSGIRRKVFCASLSDVFEQHADANTNELLNQTRSDLWSLIIKTSHLDWLLLTKRPENTLKMVPADWLKEWPENVWVGTTVENQQYADQRIPELLKVPARVRFLSVEPMMGPIDFGNISGRADAVEVWGKSGLKGIHWVIAGGESGPKAEPSHPDWFRSLRDQCVEAGVPFFFKQWGEWMPIEKAHAAEENEVVLVSSGEQKIMTSDQTAVIMRKFGKKAAGRLLDGREWNEMPE